MSRTVHPAAADGFGASADAYERVRPDYPDAAVTHMIETLTVGPGTVVADLAAGTGKLTRLLIPSGADVIAVEPVEAMRRRLKEVVPQARAMDGTAESMPLSDGSVDVVTVAQAFHWFDAPLAVAEIARVLKPGGGIGLIWNVRDERVPWVAELTEIMEPHRSGTPTHRTRSWRRGFDESGRFTDLTERSFPHEQHLTPALVVDRVCSVSFIAALPEADRRTVATQVRAALARDPGTRGRDDIVMPYRTDVFTAACR